MEKYEEVRIWFRHWNKSCLIKGVNLKYILDLTLFKPDLTLLSPYNCWTNMKELEIHLDQNKGSLTKWVNLKYIS